MTTTKFERLTAQVAASFGFPDARIAVVDHPLGGTAEKVIVEWADASVEAVLGLLTGSGGRLLTRAGDA
jgi:hypothetical protein